MKLKRFVGNIYKDLAVLTKQQRMLQFYFFQVRIGLQQRIAELEPVSELFKVKELEGQENTSKTVSHAVTFSTACIMPATLAKKV